MIFTFINVNLVHFKKKKNFKQSQLGKCLPCPILKESIKRTLYGLANNLLSKLSHEIFGFAFCSWLFKRKKGFGHSFLLPPVHPGKLFLKEFHLPLLVRATPKSQPTKHINNWLKVYIYIYYECW